MEIKEDTLRKIIEKIHASHNLPTIEVNDGEGDKEYFVARGLDKCTDKKAYLVLETDGEVNYYFNPNERDDLILDIVKIGRKK